MPHIPLMTAPFIPLSKAILTAYIFSRYTAPDESLVDAAQNFLNAAIGEGAVNCFVLVNLDARL
jgi:hypothetical protein